MLPNFFPPSLHWRVGWRSSCSLNWFWCRVLESHPFRVLHGAHGTSLRGSTLHHDSQRPQLSQGVFLASPQGHNLWYQESLWILKTSYLHPTMRKKRIGSLIKNARYSVNIHSSNVIKRNRSQNWGSSLDFATNWNYKDDRVTSFLWISYPNIKLHFNR